MSGYIDERIISIKSFLSGTELNPLIDFNKTSIDNFLPSGRDESRSGESYDTRIILNKKHLQFNNIISQIGGRLRYIKSGTTGHTFKGEIDDNKAYGVKVSAYPKKDHYGDVYDIRRPENVEISMLRLLSYFVVNKLTPHIVLPIGSFDTNIGIFVDLVKRDVVDSENKKYKEFLQMYDEGKYHDTVSILISEWANRGDLLDFLRKNYRYLTPMHWKVIFFQLLSALAIIQGKYSTFRHNDLKANNILIHRTTSSNERFKYMISGSMYKVPNMHYCIGIWDFDFACIPGVIDNRKVKKNEKWNKKINVTPEQNRYYDIHYFFNTLIKKGFCPEIMTSSKVPQEVKEFIERIVPEKYRDIDTEYVTDKGRIKVNDEYMTPAYILKNDPYFDEFRFDPTNKKKQTTSSNMLSSTKKTGKKTVKKTPNLRKFLMSESDDNVDLTKLIITKQFKEENFNQRDPTIHKKRIKKSRTISDH